MAFEIFITSSAKRAIKKLPYNIKEEVVTLCEDYIAKHPFDSEKLRKPLDECHSFHFKTNNVHYRIAYRIAEDYERIDVILVSTRENFYQKLRRALGL